VREDQLREREGRLCLNHYVVIPPKHWITVDTYLDGQPEGKDQLATPSPDLLGGMQLVIPRMLVNSERAVMPIEVINNGTQEVTLSPHTVIATLQPISGVEAVPEFGYKESVNAIPSGINMIQTRNEEKDSKNHKLLKIADLPEHVRVMLPPDYLTDSQMDRLVRLVREFLDIFSTPGVLLGTTTLVKHTIDTGDTLPIKQAPRRVPLHKRQIVTDEINKMLDSHTIRPSVSPWSSSIVLVTKKDGSVRFCIDYRTLNSVTKKDAYPLPRIDEALDTLTGAKWFCTLDLASGYWQVEMDPGDRPKTAFASQHGLFEFNVMPFGLCNAPATFERLMEDVLVGLQWIKCLVYIDDIVVFGKTFEDTIDNLRTVFERLRTHRLTLKPKKCELFKKQVAYLGHIV